MNIELSIIIVNYNGVSFFKECFESIYDKLTGISFEIIVVDNNSQDDSCRFLKQYFPEVKLIESLENLGFGRANNLGVQNAKGESVLLLNNDTILQNHLLPALKTLYSNTEIGIVGINMVSGKKEYIPAVGRFPTPFRLLRISFLNDKREMFKNGDFDVNTYDVDWLTGAFMLMRKTDFEIIDGFDADYFMYVEDVDLCKKMKNIGKKCVFQVDMSYIHFVGFNRSRENLLLKGYEIYASKHFSKLGYLIAKSMISVNRLVKLIKSKC